MSLETEPPRASSRRNFLTDAARGAAAVSMTLQGVKASFAQSIEGLASTSLAGQVDDGYWRKIREQFLLQEGLAYLNNGTVGPTPGPVFDAMVHYWRMMAENPHENSGILQGRLEVIRRKLARFVGASTEEVAIVRNTTEGNNLVCKGLDLKNGDEVLIGYLEHDSNRRPWQLKARRHGIVVKEAPIGTPPGSPEEILKAFDAAITPRTKVISLAHCDTVTGTIAPIKQLAELAHTRGALCFVDGAQALGMIPLNLRELGVDTYAATGHKWLTSPAGAALLYVRRELQDRIWPNIVTRAWSTYPGARKYENLSRRPWPAVVALEDSIDFQLAIGKERIEERMRALSGHFRQQAGRIPGVELYTSSDQNLSAGMTSLRLRNVPPKRLREYLRQRHDVYVAGRTRGSRYPADPHGVEGIRVSTHYYNTFENVNRVLQALEELSSRNV